MGTWGSKIARYGWQDKELTSIIYEDNDTDYVLTLINTIQCTDLVQFCNKLSSSSSPPTMLGFRESTGDNGKFHMNANFMCPIDTPALLWREWGGGGAYMRVCCNDGKLQRNVAFISFCKCPKESWRVI